MGRRGVARSNIWRLRIDAKSAIASDAPLRFWGAMRNQLRELGYEMGKASVLRDDNTSSIMAAKNPGQHRSQLRHLELHAWALRDLVREGQVRLEWVSTEENPSDLLTKAIASPSKFEKFQAVLLGEQKATAQATALVAKCVGGAAAARCFLVRPLCS